MFSKTVFLPKIILVLFILIISFNTLAGQMWKLTSEKKLENKDGNRIYLDKVWILPAEGAEGGPIQDFKTGDDKDFKVLTVSVSNEVTLGIKIEKEKQKWIRDDVQGFPDFFFLNTNERHLSTATSEILTGTSTLLFLPSSL